MADALATQPGATDPNAEPVSLAWQIMNKVYGIDTDLSQAKGLTTRGTPGYMGRATNLPTGTDSSLAGQLKTAGGYIQQFPGAPSKYQSLKEALADLHNKPPEWLASYTQTLYKAGFYPDKSYSRGAQPPNGKVATDEDVMATINLISTAQRYGDTKTIDEILHDYTAAGEGDRKLAEANKKTQGQVYEVVTDDPATLRAQTTKVAQALLGRNVSEAEQNALVSLMIQQEQAPQQARVAAGQAADTGTDTVLTSARVDAEARMQEKIKADNPTEAGAYGELNYYNILQQAIKGM